MIKLSKYFVPHARELVSKKTDIPTGVETKARAVKRIILIMVFGLAIVVFVPKIGAFGESFETLRSARPALVVFSVGFSLVTYVFAAVSYRSLAFFPVGFAKLLLVQVASSFATKLAPAGTGGLAINTRFLTKNRHTLTQAAATAFLNNMLGMVAHLSLLLGVIIFGPSTLSDVFAVNFTMPSFVILLATLAVATLITVVLSVKAIRSKIRGICIQTGAYLKEYKKSPLKIIVSYLASALMTLAYAGALYAAVHALGAGLSPLQVLVVFTVGIVAASVTPTPGGIGGAEAGLVAGLSATGIETSQAVSITLLFRFATYWLPIIPGFIAFRHALKKDII